MAKQPPRKAVVVGISGCTSSGKTTLSRLLRDIFPHTFILHEDDFYRPEEQLPFKHGMRDWDCVESIDVPFLEDSIAHIRSKGSSPPELVSKEDQNEVHHHGVPETTIERLRAEICEWLSTGSGKDLIRPDCRLCILDGFLLYSDQTKTIRDQLDIKLFLRTGFKEAKQRRETRNGYVTLEGFWQDPPGYFEQVVWDNFVKDHKFLFKKDDVEGEMNDALLGKLGIYAQPRLGMGTEELLIWAVEILKQELTAKESN